MTTRPRPVPRTAPPTIEQTISVENLTANSFSMYIDGQPITATFGFRRNEHIINTLSSNNIYFGTVPGNYIDPGSNFLIGNFTALNRGDDYDTWDNTYLDFYNHGPPNQMLSVGGDAVIENRLGIGTSNPSGPLHIYESTGTSHGVNTGTLILDHGDSGGSSCIMFPSRINNTSDYGYIQYEDSTNSEDEKSRLIIGTQNDGPGINEDNVILNPSGKVGIKTDTPTATLHVNGSVSKSSGSFQIDHPLPSMTDTHYLYHSFIEGPQADLIYRGVVDLVNGNASVNLDTVSNMTVGTFEALNRNIQCFTTNESDWDAVKGFVSGNILTISCQNTSSTAKVSWMVIGERKDQHMYDTDWTDNEGRVVPEKLK